MKLTTCQQNALSEFVKFINNPAIRDFMLTGSPGVGKTTLIDYLVEELAKANEINKILSMPPAMRHIEFATPTHKSASILKESLNNESYEVNTIHSLFSLRRGFNKDTGEEYYFKPRDKDIRLVKDTLLIIDEFSQINTKLLETIYANLPENCKILWLGDANQINPVNELHIPLMSLDMDSVELVTPVRFDNTELIELVTELRECVLQNRLPKLKTNSHVKLVDRDTFKQQMIEANKQGTNCKTIAWTNRMVNAYSKLVHHSLFGKDKYSIGQKLIAKSRITTQSQGIINTQSEFIIKDIPILINKDINGEIIEFYELATDSGTIDVPLVRTKAMKAIEPLKIKKQWREWYSFKDRFADVSNGYSITAHQSQSSTYDTVFIDLVDIMNNKNMNEMLRLLYVAASRARKEVIFLG